MVVSITIQAKVGFLSIPRSQWRGSSWRIFQVTGTSRPTGAISGTMREEQNWTSSPGCRSGQLLGVEDAGVIPMQAFFSISQKGTLITTRPKAAFLRPPAVMGSLRLGFCGIVALMQIFTRFSLKRTCFLAFLSKGADIVTDAFCPATFGFINSWDSELNIIWMKRNYSDIQPFSRLCQIATLCVPFNLNLQIRLIYRQDFYNGGILEKIVCPLPTYLLKHHQAPKS